MKHKIIYIVAMFAILIAALVVWNNAFQIARVLHCDSAIVDVFAGMITAAAFYPAGKVTEKEEDYV